MLITSWQPRKRLAVAAIVIAIIIFGTTISRLQYQSSTVDVSLRLPSYKGNNTTEQEIRENSPTHAREAPIKPVPADLQQRLKLGMRLFKSWRRVMSKQY
jgi:hypothetical protein